LILAGSFTSAFMPSFWALPTALLSESGAAASIGLINSVGNLGGFVGPYLIGYFGSLTHSFTPGLLVLVAGLLLAGILVLRLRLGAPPG
jgi:ACS family tartrate transporter-like MFS transporter